MYFRGIQDQAAIYKKWQKLIDCQDDIKDDTVKMSTAIVLENVQCDINERAKINNSRGLISEAAGITTAGTMGPYGTQGSIAGTATIDGNGDARVPSVVIPMIRRIYPQLIAHKLVGVQPMQGPIGMAFAFRAKYGRNSNGVEGNNKYAGDEIGYLGVAADHTGKPQATTKFGIGEDQGMVDLTKNRELSGILADPQTGDFMDCFFGKNATSIYGGKKYGMIGDGADTSDAENWAVGSTMPEAGFEILKATVTAKTRDILVSSVNMLLRDEEFDSLESLCYAFSREPQEIRDYLLDKGYVWSERQKQFRPIGYDA